MMHDVRHQSPLNFTQVNAVKVSQKYYAKQSRTYHTKRSVASNICIALSERDPLFAQPVVGIGADCKLIAIFLSW
jgi:hypothetical protein